MVNRLFSDNVPVAAKPFDRTSVTNENCEPVFNGFVDKYLNIEVGFSGAIRLHDGRATGKVELAYDIPISQTHLNEMLLQHQSHPKRQSSIRWIGWAIALLFLTFFVPSNVLAEENLGESAETELVFQMSRRSVSLDEQRNENADPFFFPITTHHTNRPRLHVHVAFLTGIQSERGLLNGCGADLRL